VYLELLARAATDIEGGEGPVVVAGGGGRGEGDEVRGARVERC
jgi:hypothetical protein